jgi:hypothetical protein
MPYGLFQFWNTSEIMNPFRRSVAEAPWTGDQPLPIQDSTTQKTEDTHPYLIGIRTLDPNVRAVETRALNRAESVIG